MRIALATTAHGENARRSRTARIVRRLAPLRGPPRNNKRTARRLRSVKRVRVRVVRLRDRVVLARPAGAAVRSRLRNNPFNRRTRLRRPRRSRRERSPW